MANNRYDSTRQWYAIHTYSGYEEKVAESIRQRINGVDMADKIFDVMVPKEKQIQIKNGKRKVVEAKIFQGYVLVEMNLTDETWYIIRNTPGVTGFVGADTTPTPVSDKESKSAWVSKSQSTRLISQRAKLFPSPMVRSKALTAQSLKSTQLKARSASWSVCLDATLQSSLTPCR